MVTETSSLVLSQSGTEWLTAALLLMGKQTYMTVPPEPSERSDFLYIFPTF